MTSWSPVPVKQDMGRPKSDWKSISRRLLRVPACPDKVSVITRVPTASAAVALIQPSGPERVESSRNLTSQVPLNACLQSDASSVGSVRAAFGPPFPSAHATKASKRQCRYHVTFRSLGRDHP